MSSFSGSERSGCRLQIFTLAEHASSFSFFSRGYGPASSQVLDFGSALSSQAELVTVSTINALGSGGGWQALLKVSADFDPLIQIPLGSWAYISMVRNGTPHLVMAGRVTHRGIQEVSANGVTTRTCNIVGASFDIIWKQTKWFFAVSSPSRAGAGVKIENEKNAVIAKIGIEYLLNYSNKNVSNILFKFADVMASFARAPFAFPSTMPGVGDSAFTTIKFDDSQFDSTTFPALQPVASGSYANVDLWTLAQSYQDGMFTEMWSDIYPSGGYAAYSANVDQEQGLLPQNAQMTIMYRTKPFPLTAAGAGTARGTSSPFFSLPTHVLQRSDVLALNLVGADEEIFNAFAFTAAGTQEAMRGYAELLYINQNASSTPLFGLRKLDATTMYVNPDYFGHADYNRKRIRDWYCLGEVLVSGSIQLGHGAPQIRVGSRVVIDDPVPALRWTFYVESVRHSWTAAGLSTSLDVTRGFRGTDAQHLARLESEALNYDNVF